MSLCKDCISGVTHEGTPTGQLTQIAGVQVYIATPSGDYSKDKVHLFLPDVLGLDLVNNLLLADDFARSGFKTIIVDYFNGDPIPVSALSGHGLAPEFDIKSWLSRHGEPETRGPLDKVISALKDEGVTRFAANGYCFGSRYVFDLAFDGAIHVALNSHPSLLQVPADLEKYSKTNVPLLMNTCDDEQFPPNACALSDEMFGEGRFSPGYLRVHFGDCKHGFAVRGDSKDPVTRQGKEGAFKSSVEFLRKYL